ncbi:MAG: intradiol ring-cleavage dioxygenase [Paracoccaceae bacterium]
MPLSTLDRRTLLKALALAPATAVVLPQSALAEAEAAGLIVPEVCLVQPELTEGPFYVDPGLIRGDIAEGRPGLPLVLRLQVVTADCRPVEGARVDVWHCDAEGVYSGVSNLGEGPDTSGQTFLRGTQMTGADGVAEFRTIYPGWYPGRTTHIHYKVFLADGTALTSQVFFDEAMTAAIYDDHAAYEERAAGRDMFNAQDRIAREAGAGAIARVDLPEPDGEAVAALVVGIAEGGQGGLLDRLFGRG